MLSSVIKFAGYVYELYGEEGSGKSQYMLYVTARALLPKTWRDYVINGENVGVVLIDNDYQFSILRLVGEFCTYAVPECYCNTSVFNTVYTVVCVAII